MSTIDLEEIRYATNRLRARASEGVTMQTSTVMNETAIVMDAIYRAERAALSSAPAIEGLSPWHGWDQSRLPWSDAKHKDAVCEAVFRQSWSVEDQHTLISFIERTWPRAALSNAEAKS